MKIDPQPSRGEALSALADGELRGAEFAAALGDAQRAGSLETWHCYHLIGDVLRSSDTRCDAGRDSAFLQGLRGRLAQETITPPQAVTPIVVRAEAANDGVWRWKMVAGLASVTAVGVLAWSVAGPTLSGGSGAVLARADTAAPANAVLVASPEGTIVRDARLDEMLDAHRQLGANSALQIPAGFIRNATFEGRSR